MLSVDVWHLSVAYKFHYQSFASLSMQWQLVVTPMTVSELLQQVWHSGVVGSRRRERRDVFEGENPSLECVRSTLLVDPSLLDLDRHGLRGTRFCVVDIFESFDRFILARRLLRLSVIGAVNLRFGDTVVRQMNPTIH
jgi:hypothetical protein